MRYIGIDYGTKKVGIALSDEGGAMGFPHAVLANSSALLDQVVRLVDEKNVAAAVIGESHNFSGGENQIARAVRDFARELEERTGIPVHFEPEMLTTQAARRFPDGSRMEGSPDVDASAAALILSSYLEREKGVA